MKKEGVFEKELEKEFEHENPIDTIRNELRGKSIGDLVKVEIFLKDKYPRLFLLCFSIVLAYVLFQNDYVASLILGLQNLSYIGIFVAGILFSFGFTAAFAVGFFIFVQPENVLLAVLIGGVGSTVADLFIFEGIRSSFSKELRRLKRTKLFREAGNWVHHSLPRKIYLSLMYTFAGLIIATPLPDEIGVGVIAGFTEVRPIFLTIISFILHSLAIYLIIVLS